MSRKTLNTKAGPIQLFDQSFGLELCPVVVWMPQLMKRTEQQERHLIATINTAYELGYAKAREEVSQTLNKLLTGEQL